MSRTIVNIDEGDKRWLDRQAQRERVPMTELVRRAVRLYRAQHDRRRHTSLRELLEQTSGIWRQGDGMAWQNRLRGEWDNQS